VRRAALFTLPLLALALASCGSSSKTAGLSFEEFKARLQSMKTPFEGPCRDCEGTGKLADRETGAEKRCETCSGTGIRKGIRGPSLAEFEAAFGKPEREESPRSDLIWEQWHYRCREGKVRLPAYLDEETNDVIRVVTGEPVLN